MFTFILYSIIKDWGWEWKTPNLNLFGNILTSIFGVILVGLMLIIIFSIALVENVFIIPAWAIYNLVHSKEYRKSYIKFLNFEETNE